MKLEEIVILSKKLAQDDTCWLLQSDVWSKGKKRWVL